MKNSGKEIRVIRLKQILLRARVAVRLMVMAFTEDIEILEEENSDSPISQTPDIYDEPAAEDALAEAADLVINTIARADDYIVLSVKKIGDDVIQHRHYCSNITMLPLFLLRLEKITEGVIEERTDTDDSD